MAKKNLNILAVMDDLFARFFAGTTWDAWKAFLAALFALLGTPEQEAIYRRCTGRRGWPTMRAREAWLVVGRRGGKSLIAALVAVFLACFIVYAGLTAPGEVLTIMVIAADKRQARVVMRYIVGFFEVVPMLRAMVTRKTLETIELSNRLVIEIHTCSFRTTRGYTLAGVICDEIAFWRSEDSANPDSEILNGLRPGMATIPGALLLCISSPYARRGALWQAHARHYGKEDSSVLLWNASTLIMNPTVDPGIVAQAFEDDPAVAAAEWGREGKVEFRSDVETFIGVEVVSDLVVPGRRELPPVPGVRYAGFVDPSGGSSDSFALGVAHNENDRVILDVVRERKPPFSPEAVVKEFASTLLAYQVSRVVGDRYGGEFPRELFRKHGIAYELSDRTKSEIFLELLPSLNSGKVELLDNPKLIAQLSRLERRTARSGKDSIDHAPGAHDDVCNAAAGALLLAGKKKGGFFVFSGDGPVLVGGEPVKAAPASPDILAMSLEIKRRST